jgi:hypothetical protein
MSTYSRMYKKLVFVLKLVKKTGALFDVNYQLKQTTYIAKLDEKRGMKAIIFSEVDVWIYMFDNNVKRDNLKDELERAEKESRTPIENDFMRALNSNSKTQKALIVVFPTFSVKDVKKCLSFIMQQALKDLSSVEAKMLEDKMFFPTH